MPASKQKIDWPGLMGRDSAMSALITAGSGPETVAQFCGGLAYLAAPYADRAAARRKWQIERSTMFSVLAARELLRLTRVKVSAICPTVMRAEAMHVAGTVDGDAVDPMDHDLWAAWSAPFLVASSIVVVPAITGWQRCPMVVRDVQWALAHNVPVHFYARAV